MQNVRVYQRYGVKIESCVSAARESISSLRRRAVIVHSPFAFVMEIVFYFHRTIRSRARRSFNMMSQTSGLYFRMMALISVLLFSTGGLAIKSVALEPLTLAGMRSLIAGLVLAAIFCLRGERSVLRLPSGIAVIGVIAYFATVTGFVIANKWTTAANAIFLQYTMPIWVLAGGALWLKERVTWDRLLSILLCGVGMGLFFMDQVETQQWLGDCVAVFTGFSFAIVVLTFRFLRDGGAMAVVVWGNALTAVVALGAGAILHGDDFYALLSWSLWPGLLWLGVFQVGLAYLCYTISLRGLPAIEVALLSLIEPVLNPLWVFLMLHETPSGWAIVGGAVILSVAVGRTLLNTRTVKTPAE